MPPKNSLFADPWPQINEQKGELLDHDDRIKKIENAPLNLLGKLSTFHNDYKPKVDRLVTFKDAYTPKIDELVTFKETYGPTVEDLSPRTQELESFQESATSRLGGLEKEVKRVDKRLKEFDLKEFGTFKSNFATRLGEVEKFNTAAASRISNLETSEGDCKNRLRDYETFKSETATALENKVGLTVFKTVHNNVVNHCNELSSNIASIENGFKVIKITVSDADGRVTDLEKRMAGLEQKRKEPDGDMKNPREMAEICRPVMGSPWNMRTPVPADDQPSAPWFGSGASGNFNNISQSVTVNRCEDCAHRTGNFSLPYTSMQPLGYPVSVSHDPGPFSRNPNAHGPLGLFGHGLGRSGGLRHPSSLQYGYQDLLRPEPPSRPHSNRDSTSECDAYNYNSTPSVHVGLTRGNGGGFFSKGKKDNMYVTIGGGGGAGGSRHRRCRHGERH
jgi:hypothetical protein